MTNELTAAAAARLVSAKSAMDAARVALAAVPRGSRGEGRAIDALRRAVAEHGTAARAYDAAVAANR